MLSALKIPGLLFGVGSRVPLGLVGLFPTAGIRLRSDSPLSHNESLFFCCLVDRDFLGRVWPRLFRPLGRSGLNLALALES